MRGEVPDARDLARRLDAVLAAAVDVLGIDDVGLMLLDDHDVLRVLGSTGRAGAVLEDAQQRLGIGPGVDTVRGGRTVMVTDLAASPEYTRLWAEVRGGGGPVVRAVLSAPVVIDGDVVGNLNALYTESHAWETGEVLAVQAYAGSVGVLLRQAAWMARSASRGAAGAEPGWTNLQPDEG